MWLHIPADCDTGRLIVTAITPGGVPQEISLVALPPSILDPAMALRLSTPRYASRSPVSPRKRDAIRQPCWKSHGLSRRAVHRRGKGARASLACSPSSNRHRPHRSASCFRPHVLGACGVRHIRRSSRRSIAIRVFSMPSSFGLDAACWTRTEPAYPGHMNEYPDTGVLTSSNCLTPRASAAVDQFRFADSMPCFSNPERSHVTPRSRRAAPRCGYRSETPQNRRLKIPQPA